MLRRRHDAEIMDDFSIQDARIDDALYELKLVNRFLGGKATTQKGFRILRTKKGLHDSLRVLDAGAGGADVFENKKERYEIIALDKNPRTCLYLQEHSRHSIICGDAMDLPFKERSVDVIHVSLFLHHFTEEKIKILLSSFAKVARHGIIINDLQRSLFALIGIKILTALFSRSAMVKNDAPLSVLRGFTKKEMTNILNECNFNNIVIERTWAFRWLVVIEL